MNDTSTLSAEPLLFDVRFLNAKDNSRKRYARILYFGIPVIIVGALLLFILLALVKWLTTGQVSTLLLIASAMMAVLIALTAHDMASTIRGGRPSADEIRMDSVGIMLVYPKGKTTTLAWSDPNVHFSLGDGSQLPKELLQTPTPYLIKVYDVGTIIPQEVFHRILTEAKLHDLVDRIEISRPWYFLGRLTFVDHHICAHRRMT